jgi:hypothetical protein
MMKNAAAYALVMSVVVVGLAIVASAQGAGKGAGEVKVTICHIPPGNPGNAHAITVGEPAVPAHLAHGDSMGGCPASPSR